MFKIFAMIATLLYGCTGYAPSNGATGGYNTGIYEYGASVINEAGTRYTFVCSNSDAPNEIVDNIYVRTQTDTVAQPDIKRKAFGPGPDGAFDDEHACDPTVVGANVGSRPFNLNGKSYAWLMTYTGASETDGHNSIMAAVSNDLINWTKSPTPIIEYAPGPDGSDGYGYGQSSMFSADGAGKVHMMYTYGTATVVPKQLYTIVDFTDVANPVLLREPAAVTQQGLTKRNGTKPESTYGGDFAYTRMPNGEQRVYTTYSAERNNVAPAFLPTVLGIAWMSAEDFIYHQDTSTWNVMSFIDNEHIGGNYPFSKAHNESIRKNRLGHVARPGELTIDFAIVDAAAKTGTREMYYYRQLTTHINL